MKSTFETTSSINSTKSSRHNRSSSSNVNKENSTQYSSVQQSKDQASMRSSMNKSKGSLVQMYHFDSDPIANIMSNIDHMKELEQTCSKKLMLKEAHQAKVKVAELKKELEVQTKQQLEDQFRQETEQLLDSQVLEMGDFNEFWNQKIAEFEIEVGRVESEMLQRHETENENVRTELEKVVPLKIKMSKKHVECKKSFDIMVKQREYLEAEYLKEQCEVLEKEEMVKAVEEKELKIRYYLDQLEVRHKNELGVLKKRIASGRDEILKSKVSELEKLLLKFQNARQQLKNEQRLDLTKMDLVTKSGSLDGLSTASKRVSMQGPRHSRRKSKDLSFSQASSLSTLSNVVSPTNNRHMTFMSPPKVTPKNVEGKPKRTAANVKTSVVVLDISNMMKPENNLTTNASSVRSTSSSIKPRII